MPTSTLSVNSAGPVIPSPLPKPRSERAGRFTLPLLGDADLSFNPPPPQFAALAAGTLGNALTDADGFDADLLATAGTLNDSESLAADGAKELDDALLLPDAITPAESAELAADTAGFLAQGDALTTDLMGGVEPGPPTPPPPTPPGGGVDPGGHPLPSGGPAGGGGDTLCGFVTGEDGLTRYDCMI